MEMFVGKPYSKKDSAPDVELLFFELIEMSYDDLLDMYNDYTQLYITFDDYTYKLNSDIVMAALKTKGAKEVNVS